MILLEKSPLPSSNMPTHFAIAVMTHPPKIDEPPIPDPVGNSEQDMISSPKSSTFSLRQNFLRYDWIQCDPSWEIESIETSPKYTRADFNKAQSL
mmetsp:Transcript_15797/g.33171  ORF Transcript_15797/g.33171 Transcript_15797/m.33171 type:complete len:95 (-) Transcript_15797:2399-2683(-)